MSKAPSTARPAPCHTVLASGPACQLYNVGPLEPLPAVAAVPAAAAAAQGLAAGAPAAGEAEPARAARQRAAQSVALNWLSSLLAQLRRRVALLQAAHPSLRSVAPESTILGLGLFRWVSRPLSQQCSADGSWADYGSRLWALVFLGHALLTPLTSSGFPTTTQCALLTLLLLPCHCAGATGSLCRPGRVRCQGPLRRLRWRRRCGWQLSLRRPPGRCPMPAPWQRLQVGQR